MTTRISWRALGTSVHLLVTDARAAVAARDAVIDVLEQVDAAYSRFRADSELSRLNARPGQTVPISPLLAVAIGAALRGARVTDGAVDPTVGRAMRLIGYDADFSQIVATRGAVALRLEAIPGWGAIDFDPVARTARVPAGVEIDLGSTGKALAADLAAEAAHQAAGCGVLVSLGGDIATAGEAPSGGWRILAAEASETPPDVPGEVIALTGGGVATSSTGIRRWRRGAAYLHHIIDPRTGLPSRGRWRTATTVAASCVDANIAATAAIVHDQGAVDWLRGLGLPSRLVTRGGAVHRLGGWPIPTAVIS
ncbi:MAG: FAD:protein FMN transferase [Chloroflexota bacterium]|nr:FAD:protein FMN transferase [Chloroflexota bacterium]